MDVSLVIPIYNVERYLKECLDSVLRNTEQFHNAGGTTEVLLIDDGSTDGSTEIAIAFADAHPGFSYHRKENGGLSDARNYGVERVQGEYLMFVDSDDVLLDGTLVRLHDAVRETGVDMATCQMARFNGKDYRSYPVHLLACNSIKSRITHINESPLLVFDSLVWNRLIRREFYDAAGLAFDKGFAYEDIPFSCKAHARAQAICILRHLGYVWRSRPERDSITQRNGDRKIVSDKLEMMRRGLAILESNGCTKTVVDEARLKFVGYDLTGFIVVIPDLDEDQARENMALISGFVEEVADEALLERLRPTTRQMLLDAANGDLDHLHRVLNYRNANYANAPVVERDGSFKIVLPDELFARAGSNALNNFLYDPPLHRVDDFERVGEQVKIRGHLYRRRINYASPDDQQVEVWIVNDATGNRLALKTEPCNTAFVTKLRGKVINHDDYRTYSYNYDWTGYEVTIDFDALGSGQIDLDDFVGENYLMLDYRNRFESGVRDMNGIDRAKRTKLEALSFKSQSHELRFRVDLRAAIILEVKPLPKPAGPTAAEPARQATAEKAAPTPLRKRLARRLRP